MERWRRQQFGAERVHWQVDDPLTAPDYEKQRRLFQSLRDQIAQRVRLFALVQVRFTPDSPPGRQGELINS